MSTSLRKVSEMIDEMKFALQKAEEIHSSGNSDHSMEILKKLLLLVCKYEQYKELEPYKGKIYDNKGQILLQWGSYDLALLMLMRAAEYYTTQNDIVSLAATKGNIGKCHHALGKNMLALEDHFTQASLCTILNDQVGISHSFWHIGKIYTELGETNLAITYLNISLNICQLKNLNSYTFSCASCLGASLIAIKNYEKALSIYKICLKASRETNNLSGAGFAESKIALCQRELGSYAESIESSERSLFELSKIKNNFYSEAIETAAIAYTALLGKFYERCINASNTSINLISQHRQSMTKDEQQNIQNEEKKIYSRLILAQVKSDLFLSSLISCERYRQQMFLNSLGTDNESSHILDINKFNEDSLRDIIITLKTTILLYQLLYISDTESQLVGWLISPIPNKDNMEINCKIIELSSFEITDIRKWVSDCRITIGLGGWSTPLPFSSNNNNQPDNFPPMHHPSTISPPPLSLLHPRDDQPPKPLFDCVMVLLVLTIFLNVLGSTLLLITPLIISIQALVLSLNALLITLQQIYKLITTLFSPINLLSYFYHMIVNNMLSSYNNDWFSKSPRGFHQATSSFQSSSDKHQIIQNLQKKYKLSDANYNKDKNIQTIQCCKDMYNVLIRPFQADIQQCVPGTELLLVTHDVLGLVPFPSLIDTQGNYFIQHFKLRQTPSIFLIWELHCKANEKRGMRRGLRYRVGPQNTSRLWQSVFVGGKTTFFSAPRLFSTESETSNIHSLLQERGIVHTSFGRAGPTVDEVSGALANASVLHLSTHGSRGGYLLLKGLSEKEKTDDYFRPTDVYHVFQATGGLRPDLVVLNTCCLLEGGQSMDNVDGMVRALLSCGVSCVVSTISEIDDASAQELINHFYHALLGIAEQDISSSTAPLDTVESLQAAMFRQSYHQDNYAYPDRWAGYVVTGLPVDMHGPVT